MSAGTAVPSLDELVMPRGSVRVLPGGHYGGDLMYGTPDMREMVGPCGTVLTFSRGQRREQARVRRKRGDVPNRPEPPASATARDLHDAADQLTALADSSIRMTHKARAKLRREASLLRIAAEGRERDAQG